MLIYSNRRRALRARCVRLEFGGGRDVTNQAGELVIDARGSRVRRGRAYTMLR